MPHHMTTIPVPNLSPPMLTTSAAMLPMKSEPMTVTVTNPMPDPTPTSSFDELFAGFTPSPATYNVNMNDELNDLLEIAAEEFKIESVSQEEPLEDPMVVEDPMDPWNSVNSVWEQPLSSVGMDFNFDNNPHMAVVDPTLFM